MKRWSFMALPTVGITVGMVSLLLPLAALAQTSPTFTPQQQAFLDELKARVSSRLYQSRIRNQPDTYVLVGEGACQEMREQGYAAVIRKQNSTSGPMTLQNQPQGNGSYRGQLQLQMGRTVVEAARKHLCPDAPDKR